MVINILSPLPVPCRSKSFHPLPDLRSQDAFPTMGQARFVRLGGVVYLDADGANSQAMSPEEPHGHRRIKGRVRRGRKRGGGLGNAVTGLGQCGSHGGGRRSAGVRCSEDENELLGLQDVGRVERIACGVIGFRHLRQAQTPRKTTRCVGGIATIEFQVVEAFHLPFKGSAAKSEAQENEGTEAQSAIDAGHAVVSGTMMI